MKLFTQISSSTSLYFLFPMMLKISELLNQGFFAGYHLAKYDSDTSYNPEKEKADLTKKMIWDWNSLTRVQQNKN